jgi:signal transduction histidine kinase
MALLIILLLSITVGSIVWDSMDAIVSQQLKKRGAEIGAHVALLGGNYVLMDDFYNLYELASQTLASSDDIRYIVIMDNNNRLLAHTFHGGIPKGLLAVDSGAISLPYQTDVYNSNEGLIYDVVVPIENGAVGFVRVGMTEAYTRAALSQHIRDVIVAIMLVCGLAVALSSRIARLITKPIHSLAHVAESITHGDLAVRANIDEDSELGKLAMAFNEMATSLISTNAEKETLLSELRQKEQLRDSLIQKLMTAQEDERKRISRELHDETSQALTSLVLTMRILAEDALNDQQREALLTGRDVAAGILREVRDLAVELRPPALDDLGLVAAIERYIEKISIRHGLTIHLYTNGQDSALDGKMAVALYRIIQESLNNVVKHSDAKRANVSIEVFGNTIALTISDDGKGISSEDLIKAQQESRLGLYGMRERVELLQGTMTIHTADTGGTELRIVIPQSDGKGAV